MAQFVPFFLVLLSLAAAQYDYPQAATNLLTVSCGVGRNMTIDYVGDIDCVYAATDSTCKAKEIDSMSFRLYIDVNSTPCPIKRDESLEVYYLDIVLQKGSVRAEDDLVTRVTCNYMVGASASSVSKATATGEVKKDSLLENAGSLVTGDLNLTIHTDDGMELANGANVNMGDYIQLRASLAATSGSEGSLRVWNCKAMDASNSDTYYNLLVGGCGERKVIKETRGFLTAASGTNSLARSTFFRAFALPNVDQIQFECEFIICPNSECNGPSCPDTESSLARTKRAAAEEAVHKVHNPSSTIGLPSIKSPAIYVIHIESPKHTPISQDDLLMIPSGKPGAGYSHVPVDSEHVHQMAGEEGMDTLTMALLISLGSLGFVVLVSLICGICVCKKVLEHPSFMSKCEQSCKAIPLYDQSFNDKPYDQKLKVLST